MGRIVSGVLATVTVAGCAVLVVGMGRAGADRRAAVPRAQTTALSTAPLTSIPAQLPVTAPAHSTPAARATALRPSESSSALTSARVPPSAAVRQTAAGSRPTSTPHPRPTGPAATPAGAHTTSPTRPAAPPTRSTARSAPRRGGALPLRLPTGAATRVITVVARSTSSTTATLQAWNKAPGGGWLKAGHAVTAHVGSDGLSRSPSESRSATPIGSFTLTHAFGRDADPGTRLPYLETTPSDWWISQPGRLYNTHQRCSSNCAFTRGNPNEHLYYETPYYNYAVVIDYNTRHVRQGAGSAFFLHVTDGRPTAGCVSIPQSRLVAIMRWLAPSAHPRILIGV